MNTQIPLGQNSFLAVLAVLCTMTRMVILPMNSMKRWWWLKMGEKSPSWRESRKIWFHRWVRNKFKPYSFKIIFWIISFECCLLAFQGIVKLDHPCIHVDFPIVLCEVWSIAQDLHSMRCGHMNSSQSKVLFQCPNVMVKTGAGVWREKGTVKTVILHSYIESNVVFEFTYGQRLPCLLNPYFDINKKVLMVQVVFPLPSWHVGSFREYITLSCISLVSFFAGKKNILYVKRL